MEPVIKAYQSGLSFEERHPIVKKGLTHYFVRDMVERWADDLVDVSKQLDSWNQSDLFKGKLDLERVGVFGHSRGGGAAGEALLRKSRIKAGANLDGVQWGQIADTAFQKPFLFLSADWPAEHQDLNAHAYVNKSKDVFYEGMIRQSGHPNFMDIPYMIPFQAISQAGSIDPDQAIEISGKVVARFFDKHLKMADVDMKAMGAENEMLEWQLHRTDTLRLAGNH